jgi:hypothetical protein
MAIGEGGQAVIRSPITLVVKLTDLMPFHQVGQHLTGTGHRMQSQLFLAASLC